MAFEEMLLFNLLDLPVLKSYHLLMLNFTASLLTKLTWAAAFIVFYSPASQIPRNLRLL